MDRQFDILVAGELNPDLILTHPNLEPQFGQVETIIHDAVVTIGSSSAIFACGAARLGLKVAFIGVVGKDVFGDFMLSGLQSRGVDVSNVTFVENKQTGFSVILNRTSDRAIMTYIGTINSLQAEQVSNQVLVMARHLHVASYFLQTAIQPGLPNLFQRAREHELTVSLDTNWDPDGTWQGIRELLPLTSVFLPNEAEALSIARASTLDDAAQDLALMADLVVVKLGRDGGLACQGTKIVQLPAIPIQVSDTVGAGDSFDAGFLCGYLHGWDMTRCLGLAIACGSLSTRGRGGTETQPDLSEALYALSND